MRDRRLEKKLTLRQCSRALEIQEKYLEALETADYQHLPGEVYIKAWIKKYADWLSLNPQEIIVLYDKEKTVRDQLVSADKEKKIRRPFKASWTPRRLRLLGIGLILLLIVLYVAFAIYSSLRPPRVTLENTPSAGFRTQENSIILKGQTEPEVILEINDKVIALDAAGKFEQDIVLHDGLNEIAIRAQKKHSRQYAATVTILKTSLPQLQTSTPPLELPTGL